MNKTFINWTDPLEKLDQIKILSEQGHSSFNPIEYWKETNKKKLH